MTDHLTKTSGPFPVPQGDQVVSDPDKGPVCLDSVPGTHKDLAKSEVLLDVLVEGFDPDPLKVKRDHLRFGHLEIVGDKEPDTVLLGSGNKQKDCSDLGQMDQKLGHAKASLLGSTDRFAFPRSLGQVTEGDLLSVDFHKTVSLDRGQKCPLALRNKIENGSAGIPGIHQDRRFDWQRLDGFGKDLDGQLNFAFESPSFAGSLGAVSPDCPEETLVSDLENACHSTKSLNKTFGSVMNAESFDLFSLPRTRSIVEDQERVFPGTSCSNLPTIFALKFLGFLRRCCHKLVKTVCILLAVLRSDFSDRTKFHKPEQTNEVNQKIGFLRFGNGSQEIRETRRNFSGNIGSHGFHALLGCDSKRDFGWKPFYLKLLASLIT